VSTSGEGVDPALAALWETSVLAPLRAARAALLDAAEPKEAERVGLARRELVRARESVVAAAEAIVDDDQLRERLAGEAAALQELEDTLTDAADVVALRRNVAGAEARLARVFA
jgi:hypothetical protein